MVQELVRDFERENPGVRVRVQQIPWTAAHEKLLTAHVGHATPDIAQLGNTWISEFVALGALEPLERWRAGSSVTAESYFPGIWDTNVVDGVLYGVPWYVDTRVLFYRRDLLANAGYPTMPQDWADWLAAMRPFAGMEAWRKYAIFLPINEWPPQVILGLQPGSPLLGDHGATAPSASRPSPGPSISTSRSTGTVWRRRCGATRSPISTRSSSAAPSPCTSPDRGTSASSAAGCRPSCRTPGPPRRCPDPTGPESGVSLAGGSSLVLFRSSAPQGRGLEADRVSSRGRSSRCSSIA